MGYVTKKISKQLQFLADTAYASLQFHVIHDLGGIASLHGILEEWEKNHSPRKTGHGHRSPRLLRAGDGTACLPKKVSPILASLASRIRNYHTTKELSSDAMRDVP